MKNRATKYLLLSIFAITTCTSAWGVAKSLLHIEKNMPKTSTDYSFSDRTTNAQTGYAPFAGTSAFKTIDVESEEAYLDRMIRRAEQAADYDLATMPRDQYCDKYPLDEANCKQTPGLYEAVVAIGDNPNKAATQTPSATATTQTSFTPTIQTQQTTTVTGRNVGTDEFGRPVIASPKIHNGPCTLPQRSTHYVNKIYTSGQYAKSDPAFEKIMIATFRAEGGCDQLKGDSGGYTCYGISQNNNPEINVRNITRADAERIANDKYYRKLGIEKLPDYIRGDVFTFGWASGPVTGIKHFCRVLKIPERGKIDDDIVHAAENYSGDLHNDYLDDMQEYFKQVAKRGSNSRFLRGWMERVKLTRENGCHVPTTDPLTR